MKILGIGCSSFHDPSAALLIDGEVVAAAEEERFTRDKHAFGQNPVHAARFCLAQAGIEAKDLDLIAYPWSADILHEKRWEYAKRAFPKAPSKALRAFTKLKRLQRRRVGALHATLRELGIDPNAIETEFVEHHLAHASSAFHCSGFPSCALLTADGEGEVTSTLLGEGLADRTIKKHREVLKPDSLGLFYSTMTEYLGFRSMNGEYKVMGMAPFGDPSKVDLSRMVQLTETGFRCDDERVWVARKNRHGDKHFARAMVDELGPPRQGDGLSEPYIHIAAATQKLLEDTVLGLVDRHLLEVLERHEGRLAFAGGVALNVRLNRKLIEHPAIKQLWVQPASSDAGIALGAATFVSERRGVRVKPMQSVALGPSYDGAAVREVLERYKIPYEVVSDPADTAAELLAAGHIVSWFQGRMEFGPRALGQRSILGNPGIKGTADEINSRIKFRENWRPFCPSILAERASEVFDNEHDSPFMTFSFGVRPEWREKIPEVVHVDGSARPQLVRADRAPAFYELLKRFEAKSGLPVVINTSLNRRGEPMVCSPEDAVAMFFGSGLEFMVIEDVLVRKRPEAV
ncbi:MAG TPA: carbamoyltransferase [Planctomycetes bacterium]|nr:carbamoyltransferase [Planctomycetota bacterium]